MLGFIETDNPKPIRQALQRVRDGIRQDPYLQDIPSLKKSLQYFHATDDCPEVREKVYKCLDTLNFKSQFVIAKRGSKNRQEPLEKAIEHARTLFERKFLIKIKTNVRIQSQMPTDEPCLQVVDYMNWAIYRVFVKREMRYYRFIKDKVSFIWDIYDTEKYPRNFYHENNELDINKISLL